MHVLRVHLRMELGRMGDETFLDFLQTSSQAFEIVFPPDEVQMTFKCPLAVWR